MKKRVDKEGSNSINGKSGNNYWKVLVFCFVFVGVILFVQAFNVEFVDPTPENESSLATTFVPVNISSTVTGDFYSFLNFDDSLVLWMRMDDVNGSGDPTDLTYAHNGSLIADASIGSSGKFGNQLVLDGTGDYVAVPDNSNLEGFSEMTISAWVKMASHSDAAEDVIVSKWDSQDTYMLRYDSQNNQLDFYIGLGGTAGGTLGDVSIEDEEWHHVVGVYNGTQVYGYVDGIILGTLHDETGTIGSNSDDLRIGHSPSDTHTSDFFEGEIDEVLIFNRALSEDEILALNGTLLDANIPTSNNQTYTFKGYVVNSTSYKNETDTYFTTVGDSSINITFPTQYVFFQRDNSTHGEVTVNGTYSGTPTTIQAQFNNQGWHTLDSTLSSNSFSGSFNATVGNGTIEVRFSNNVSINDSIANISIGDLYVIAGQSNAEGRATNEQNLNSSNLYLSTVYREDDAWILANDPVDTGSSSGSPFPLVANYLIQNLSVPVGFISAATGGTEIVEWQKGQTQYDNMYDQIQEGTYGTMKVKSVLFHQGESDANPGTDVSGDYSSYTSNLSAFVASFLADTTFSTTAVIAQIGYKTTGSTNRALLDGIKKAHLDSWDNNENISAGPNIYDIPNDGVHFTTDSQVDYLAQRWTASILYSIYGIGDGRGPIINNVTFTEGDNDTLILNFTEDSLPLKIEFWNGTSSGLASGFSFYLNNGTFLTTPIYLLQK